MEFDYYKIYTRTGAGYLGPVIIKSREELLKKGYDSSNFLIIGHNNKLNSDTTIILQKCKIEQVEDLQSNIEVKTFTFKPNELHKETKAKQKQELYKMTKDYIDR
jgi:hypothetical protein